MQFTTTIDINIKYPYYAEGTKNATLAKEIHKFCIDKLDVKSCSLRFNNPDLYYYVAEDGEMHSTKITKLLRQVFERNFTKINDIVIHNSLTISFNDNSSDFVTEHNEQQKTVNDDIIEFCDNDNSTDLSNQEGHAFNYALMGLNSGHLVTRKEWYKKGIFIFKMPDRVIEISQFDNPYLENIFRTYGKHHVTVEPLIAKKTEFDTIDLGYTISEKDILANDWIIISR